MVVASSFVSRVGYGEWTMWFLTKMVTSMIVFVVENLSDLGSVSVRHVVSISLRLRN